MTAPTCSACGCAWTANTKPGNCERCDHFVELVGLLMDGNRITEPEAVRLAVQQMARARYR